MMISTRGRYALRVMIDLAEHTSQGYIPMKEVAGRQGISLKYLERIMPSLSKSGLVTGIQGKGGGYRLSRPPEEYTVGMILRLTEGSLAPVSCLEDSSGECGRRDACVTREVWMDLYDAVSRVIDGVTIADLARRTRALADSPSTEQVPDQAPETPAQ